MQRTHAIANQARRRRSEPTPARHATGSGLADQVLELQRLCGNQAVQRLLAGPIIQRATYDDFGHPFPEDNDEAEYKFDGPAAWQHAKLKKGLGDLQAATLWLMQNAIQKPDNAGAAATDYMHLFGLVAMGYMWARMVKAAQARLGADGDGSGFSENKLITGRYFMERVMPETTAHLARISTGADTMMALPAEAF